MDFIFMLTRGDRTVENCLDVLDEIAPLGLRHIGFKDIGVEPRVLRQLADRIHAMGATSYVEVVSETPEAALASARVGATLGVDRLLGGTDVEAIRELLAGTRTQYYPFPGFPVGHPTRLGGGAEAIAGHCARFMARGCAGADLLAFRATEAEPLELIRAARSGLGPEGYLIVAGSVDSAERIRAVAAAGADAFTIGTAVFEGAYSRGRDSVMAQLEAVIADNAAA